MSSAQQLAQREEAKAALAKINLPELVGGFVKAHPISARASRRPAAPRPAPRWWPRAGRPLPPPARASTRHLPAGVDGRAPAALRRPQA